MDVQAQVYENSHDFQTNVGRELLKQVRDNNLYDSYGIGLDIGSGSGNITEMFQDQLNIPHVYGIDVDCKMIEFAINNHPGKGIQYVQQDFGQEFHEMNDTIKALEGKVDLIWSNCALHWIENKDNMVKSIAKLAKTNCQVYLDYAVDQSTYLFNNWLFGKSPEEELVIISEQFKCNGFEVKLAQIIERSLIHDQDQFQAHILPVFVTWVKKRIPFISKRIIYWLFWYNFLSPVRQFNDMVSGKPMIESRIKLINLILRKI